MFPSDLPDSHLSATDPEELPASGPISSAAWEELRNSVTTLRRQLQVTLAALVLMLAALNVYLLRQVMAVRQQATAVGHDIEQMNQAIWSYQTNSVPYMDKLTTDLRRFAASHPDFAATLSRYTPAPDATRGGVQSPVSPQRK